MILKNARREAFAQGVAKGLTGTEAAKSAGYSVATACSAGSRLLKNVEVLSRIDELRQQSTKFVSASVGVDRAWVLAELIDNVKRAKQAEPVRDSEGNPIGEYQQDLRAANRSLELIGKEFGMFVDRKEIRTGPLGTLTETQLDQLIAAIVAGTPAEVLAVLGAAGEAAQVQGTPAGVLPTIQ